MSLKLFRFAGVLSAAAQLSFLPLAAQTFAGSADLDKAIDQAIREKGIPGAVVVAGRNGKILHSKAYGHRAVSPAAEAMTLDTIFDCASLTKVVATTSALM